MPEINVSPKPAMQPSIVLALAAPRPDTSPAARPFASVRRMHSAPIGPTGAAIEKRLQTAKEQACVHNAILSLNKL